jgi:hypothetical protein
VVREVLLGVLLVEVPLYVQRGHGSGSKELGVRARRGLVSLRNARPFTPCHV